MTPVFLLSACQNAGSVSTEPTEQPPAVTESETQEETEVSEETEAVSEAAEESENLSFNTTAEEVEYCKTHPGAEAEMTPEMQKRYNLFLSNFVEQPSFSYTDYSVAELSHFAKEWRSVHEPEKVEIQDGYYVIDLPGVNEVISPLLNTNIEEGDFDECGEDNRYEGFYEDGYYKEVCGDGELYKFNHFAVVSDMHTCDVNGGRYLVDFRVYSVDPDIYIMDGIEESLYSLTKEEAENNINLICQGEGQALLWVYGDYGPDADVRLAWYEALTDKEVPIALYREYYDLVSSLDPAEWDGFQLIDLDYNDMPELFATCTSGLADDPGMQPYMIVGHNKDGIVVNDDLRDGVAGAGGYRGSLYYLAGHGKLHDVAAYAPFGEPADTIYVMEDGQINYKVSGCFEADRDSEIDENWDLFEHGVWKWDGETVSEEEYQEKLQEETFGDEGSPMSEIDYMDKADMLDLLSKATE